MPRAARTAVTIVFFASGASYGSWVARIPALQDGLDATKAELGLALFGVAAGAILGLPLAGVLSVRFGSRRVTRVALLAVALAMPLPALAPSLLLLGLGFAALGASNGILDVAMNAHGVAVEGRYERPILTSFHAAFSLGGLTGAAVGGASAALGVSPLAQFTGAGLAIAAIWLWTAGRLLPRDVDIVSGGPVFGGVSRGLVALSALAFGGMLAEGAAADWSGVFLNDTVGTGEGAATTAFIAFSVTMTIGRLVGDRMTARFGTVPLTRASGSIAAAGLLLALAVLHPASAVLGFACVGAGLAVVIPTVYRAAAGHTTVPGAGIAAVSTVGYAAFLVGPPAIGFLADLTSLRVALGAVVCLCGMIALLAGATAPAAAPRR